MIPEWMNCPHLPDGWCLTCLQTMIPRATVADALAKLWTEFEQKHYLRQDSALDLLRDTIFELKLDTEVDESKNNDRTATTRSLRGTGAADGLAHAACKALGIGEEE